MRFFILILFFSILSVSSTQLNAGVVNNTAHENRLISVNPIEGTVASKKTKKQEKRLERLKQKLNTNDNKKLNTIALITLILGASSLVLLALALVWVLLPIPSSFILGLLVPLSVVSAITASIMGIFVKKKGKSLSEPKVEKRGRLGSILGFVTQGIIVLTALIGLIVIIGSGGLYFG